MTYHKGQCQTASCCSQIILQTCPHHTSTTLGSPFHFVITMKHNRFLIFCECNNGAKMSSNCPFFFLWVPWYLNSFWTHEKWCWPWYCFTHHLWPQSISLATHPWAHPGTPRWSSSCWSLWKARAQVENSTAVQWNNPYVPSKHRLNIKHPEILQSSWGSVWAVPTPWPRSVAEQHSSQCHTPQPGAPALPGSQPQPARQLWKQHLPHCRNT